MTPNRKAILAEIEGRDDHPSAADIMHSLRGRNPRIAYGSIYNALRFLADTGYVRELHFGDGVARYDRNTIRHDHAVCTECGRLVDVGVALPQDLAVAAAAAAGFQLQMHHVELYGLCESCRRPDGPGPTHSAELEVHIDG
jgi:Fe2+ or Zn2+ uptake regulation protein